MTALAQLGEPEARRIGGIPIRNLYIMLAFADALRNELSAETCGAMASERFPLDILAKLLLNKLQWLRRRGTPRSYRTRGEVNATPEGTLDFAGTLRGMHLVHNRLAFVVDELQLDTPHNRLLCAGIRALLRSDSVKDEHAIELRRQLAAFPGVAYVSASEALRVRWDRAPAAAAPSYREALGLARLAVLATLPDEAEHDRHWRKLLDDQARMGQLFEEFLRGFLQFESGLVVRKRTFRWAGDDASGLVPSLETDLFIERADGIVVGESKLYKSPLLVNPHGQRRLRADHLNQLFAYLSATSESYPGERVEGLLIYALVDEPFDADIVLRGYAVRVRTVDLSLEWPALREQLLTL